jgi:hypothetical protein
MPRTFLPVIIHLPIRPSGIMTIFLLLHPIAGNEGSVVISKLILFRKSLQYLTINSKLLKRRTP